jgi:hypothetical protein
MPDHATKPKNETDQAEHLLSGARKLRKRLRDFEIGGISAHALERVIRQYRQLGTQIILIGPPVSSPYRRFYEKSIDHKFNAYMKHLGKTYSASYYDYRARLPDSLFSSVYYATAAGAEQFSRLVAQEILLPLLANSAKPAHHITLNSKPAATTQTVAIK